MNTLPHADAFFFVSTICFGILTVFLIIVLAYAIKLLNDAKKIMDRAKMESDFFFDELRLLGSRMNATRFGFLSVFRLIRRMAERFT